MFLTFSYFTFYGMMAVGLTPTQHLAAVISSAFYSLWNLMSGFLVPAPVSTLFLNTHSSEITAVVCLRKPPFLLLLSAYRI